MIDIIGSIALASLYATVLGVLAGLAPVSRSIRLAVWSGAALWGALIVAVAAFGWFGPGATGPVPGVALAFAAAVGGGIAAWFLLPGFGEALLSLPPAALVGLNAGRLLGAFFVLLYAAGRLPAPFAPAAGWGDVAVGALAVPLTALAAAGTLRAQWLRLWNALGALDLVVAVSLGVLSAPATPFRVFTQEPGTAAMGMLPWIMIPMLLVPLYLLIHLTVAAKLRASPRAMPAVAAAGS